MAEAVLHLGDCVDVMRTMADGAVSAIVTDPPFGARRPRAWRSAGVRFAEVENNGHVFIDWLGEAYRVLADGGVAYVFTCWDRLEEWRAAMQEAAFKVRSCIVWDKGLHGLADLETCWAPQHELILFAAKGRHILHGKRPKDIITAQRVDPSKLAHPYQKPIKAILPLIQASTQAGDLILDPFMGVGTTGVACLKTGRKFIGIEIEPEYHRIAQRRLDEARTPLLDAMEATPS